MPLDDWANGGCVDVLVASVVSFTYDEYGFSSLGSWSYSREWIRYLRTILCCIATGK